MKRLLMRQGHAVSVAPRAVDVLIVLVRQRGTAVGKDDLMRAVWQDAIVEDNSLTVSISALRKALGQSIRDRRYIVTIPRRGYTFVAAVVERSADAETIEPRSAAGRSQDRIRVLTLPFELLAEDSPPGAGSLALAVADGCAARLGSSQHVAALTRPQVARTRGADPLMIARRLDAGYVLSGTLRLDNSRLRVLARLLRTADGHSRLGRLIRRARR